MSTAITGSEEAMKVCIVATDFSETAGKALNRAIQIAKGQPALELVIMHAMASPIPPEMGIDFVIPAPDMDARIEKYAKEKLEKLLAKVQAEGISARMLLSQGSAADCILKAAEENNADLIVQGTRGLTGWEHVVMGSTASHVLRDAKCPVISVHPTSAKATDPIRTILVPTDFSEDADLAVHAAFRILRGQEGEVKVVLLHTYDIPMDYAGFSGITLVTERKILEQVTEKLADVGKKFQDNGVSVETRVRRGYAPVAILDEARDLNVDLIAMGTHGYHAVKRFFMGSTADRVLQRSDCPVLTIRH